MEPERLEALLERIAVGVEQMGAEPEIEIDAGPPLCPACGNVNPKVHLPPSDGGMGFLAEIMIEAQCECGSPIYVVIESYSCHRQRETALAEARGNIRNGGWTNE